MAFVSEKIENKDIDYFNSYGFKDVLGNPVKAYWWAIDKKRNIFLFPRGGGSFDIPVSFGLCTEGELINIEVIKVTEGNLYDNDLKIHWLIRKICVPGKIKKGYDENEIRGLVQEAFIGLGTTGIERTKILNVTVKIMTELEIV